jgi:hypothetical protein
MLRFLSLTTATILITFVMAGNAVAGMNTLTSKNFNISITNNCEEGTVVCQDVTYVGTNRRSGKSIRLRGKTVHTLCADGVTPCRFLGYSFTQGKYSYFVGEEGVLRVFKGKRLILQEVGQWNKN